MGNNIDKPSEGQRSLRKVEDENMLCWSFTDEAVIKIKGTELIYSQDGVSVRNKEETPKSPEGTLEDGVFEIDATRLAANVGRNVARLIAKGIVQDHYDGDWSKVRFIGLGEELRDLPCPSGGGELREEHTLRSPKGTLREEHTPKSPLGRGEMRIAV